MSAWRYGLLTGIVAGTAVAAVALGRPARIRRARVVGATGAAPEVARVELEYGLGVRPASLIVDVAGARGGGSATIDGDETAVEIPIIGELGGRPRITTTAAYRVASRLRTRVQEFAGE